MDKEGQKVQFSSADAPKKQTPDYFISSNDKTATRERNNPFLRFFKVCGVFFRRAGAALKRFFSAPFTGRNKVISIAFIAVVVVLVAGIVVIAVNRAGWQNTDPKITGALSDEELAEWSLELGDIVTVANNLEDRDQVKTYYTELIKNEPYEYKANDLTIEYARALALWGQTEEALKLLNAIDQDDLECEQIMNQYEAYAYIYIIANGSEINGTAEEYFDRYGKQEEICWAQANGEELPSDDGGVNTEDAEDDETITEEMLNEYLEENQRLEETVYYDE